MCLKSVASNHRAVNCDSCNLWAHIKCANVSPREYSHLSRLDKFDFVCPRCLMHELPTHDIDCDFPQPENDIHCPLIEDLNEFDNIASNNGLKIAHLNINGLFKKIDHVRILICNTKLDVLAISESKLNKDISDAEISIPNFKLFRIDRDCHGDGVVIYCKENVSSFDCPKLCSKEFESLWVKIKLKKIKPIHICVSYRSPSVKKPIEYVTYFYNYLKSCLGKLPRGTEVICLGDYNVNWSKHNGLTSLMKDFARSSNLSQLIESPTRITEHSSTLIDLIFTNSTSISQSGSIFFGLSDHNLIFCIRKCIKPKLNPKTILFRNFKNFNKDKFTNDLLHMDWSRFYNSPDVDEATSIFNSIVSEISDKHAPFCQKGIKGNCSPWINEEFLIALRERDYLLKVASRSQSQADWTIFKKKRNAVNKLKNRLRVHIMLTRSTILEMIRKSSGRKLMN